MPAKAAGKKARVRRARKPPSFKKINRAWFLSTFGLSEDEIYFQIEIMYDFLDEDERNEEEIARRIARNFKIPIDDALEYVKRYVEGRARL